MLSLSLLPSHSSPLLFSPSAKAWSSEVPVKDRKAIILRGIRSSSQTELSPLQKTTLSHSLLLLRYWRPFLLPFILSRPHSRDPAWPAAERPLTPELYVVCEYKYRALVLNPSVCQTSQMDGQKDTIMPLIQDILYLLWPPRNTWHLPISPAMLQFNSICNETPPVQTSMPGREGHTGWQTDDPTSSPATLNFIFAFQYSLSRHGRALLCSLQDPPSVWGALLFSCPPPLLLSLKPLAATAARLIHVTFTTTLCLTG